MKNSTEKLCFIDFDGTIIDNKQRLYNFFIDNIPSGFSKVINVDEFWELKRLGINEVDWINSIFDVELNVEVYNRLKAKGIEDEYYLKYDVLLDYAKPALELLSREYKLVLVTRRENSLGLLEQVQRNNLNDFFDDIIVLKHNSKKKSMAILEKYKVSEKDIFIGDTEDDLLSGIDLGCKTFFVLSGIRSRWIIFKNNIGDVVTMDNIYEVAKSITGVIV